MQTIRLMSISGARPNFMKLAAIAQAVDRHNQSLVALSELLPVRHIIVHTGQHYDQKMSHGFFDDLGIPRPNVNLEVGSGSHAVQTAEIMRRFEPVLMEEQPDILLVVGDVNSTIACTLVAAKIEYPAGCHRKRPRIVHVEAGLRSFDRDMPEEINRILTDALSDLLFVTEQSGLDNLEREGVASEKIHLVGNVMIDTLISHLDKAHQSAAKARFGMPNHYGLVTLHRPSNVDRKHTLTPLIECLVEVAERIPLYFPVHPRTLNSIRAFGLTGYFDWSLYHDTMECQQGNSNGKPFHLMPPLGYLDFLGLVQSSGMVITDSGGIQEETTYLQIPCVTLRESTERPITVTEGSNFLTGVAPEQIRKTVDSILSGNAKQSRIPPFWDGKAGERIVSILVGSLVNSRE